MRKSGFVSLCLVMVVGCVIWASRSDAYPTYSSNRDATRCRGCHGDFRASNYTSLTDGQAWGNLHDKHRITMLSGDCNTCHMGSGTLRFPVYTNKSAGGTGLSPIGCLGCHGRSEDAGHDGTGSAGLGAGLRQHHTSAGVGVCMGCHQDAYPANYTPVDESVLPPYYFVPDAAHPNKPTDPCNAFGEENFAGIIEGLDNDGNNIYDILDPGCKPPFYKVEVCHVTPVKSYTLSINGAALAAHLIHGDTLGQCAVP